MAINLGKCFLQDKGVVLGSTVKILHVTNACFELIYQQFLILLSICFFFLT